MDIYAQLRRDEGVRNVVYPDSRGILTVGVGHNLHTPLSARVIQVILEDDVAACEQELKDNLPWVVRLNQARYGAMVNLCFNLGIVGLEKFVKMLAHLKSGEWVEAARELRASHAHAQEPQRIDRLAQQIEKGEWV